MLLFQLQNFGKKKRCLNWKCKKKSRKNDDKRNAYKYLFDNMITSFVRCNRSWVGTLGERCKGAKSTRIHRSIKTSDQWVEAIHLFTICTTMQWKKETTTNWETYHHRIEFIVVAIHPIGGQGFLAFDANFGHFLGGRGWQKHESTSTPLFLSLVLSCLDVVLFCFWRKCKKNVPQEFFWTKTNSLFDSAGQKKPTSFCQLAQL